MSSKRIFLEGKPAPFIGTGYGHYYLVLRDVDAASGHEMFSENDKVIRGGPSSGLGAIAFGTLDVQTDTLWESDDAYVDDGGNPTSDRTQTSDRFAIDITDFLLAANSDATVESLWAEMAIHAQLFDEVDYDYELPDFAANHLSNSNSVIFSVLNAVNFDVREVEDDLNSTVTGGVIYPRGFAGATNNGDDPDPTILGQSNLPGVSASEQLTSGAVLLGRGDVNDIFTGTKFADRYYGYQEFELPFFTEDTVSYERIVKELNLGGDGVNISVKPRELDTYFKSSMIEITGVNIDGSSDLLHSIERVELTHNPDTLDIDAAVAAIVNDWNSGVIGGTATDSSFRGA